MYLLQRKTTPIGKGLGKTSGWVHRAALKAKGVEQVTGVVTYDRIDDDGPARHRRRTPARTRRAPSRSRAAHSPSTTSCVCAGQESVRTLVADALQERGLTVHVIGGADVAAELDAKRAIRQGTELAARI